MRRMCAPSILALLPLLLVAVPLRCSGDSARWSDPARPLRVRIVVPGEFKPRERVCAELPLDLDRDLARLGLPSDVDRASLRLIEIGPAGSETDVPVEAMGASLVWKVPATAAGMARSYELYFRTGPQSGPLPPAPHVVIPDYAADAYGHGWDFKRNDFESIDTFGDRPWNFRSRKVEDGIMKLDVTGDAYFIWGAMWGPAGRSIRPVSIDLARYPVLEMRVRQSVPEANWRVMGRPGRGEALVQYDFHVSGTDWQTLRIDLRRDARWHGVLTALRIDPAKYLDAHVEFDWVKLLSLIGADRSALELRGESPAASRVVVSLASKTPRVASEQIATVTTLGPDGNPLAGRPVRVELAPGSGGELAPDRRCPALPADGGLRLITGKDGTATLRYHVSSHAGRFADTLVASAEFSPAAPVSLGVSPHAGPAFRYTLQPIASIREPVWAPAILPRGVKRLAVTARLADEWNNPVPGGGRRVYWSAPGASFSVASSRTGPDGSAHAILRCDPARRWVVNVMVRDDAGLAGISAAVCALPAGSRRDPVHILPNGYFAAGSRPWMPLGGFYANWVGTPSPDGEWYGLVSFYDATDEQITAWLKLLKASGVTAERFMLRAHRPNGMEPMDIGGRVNPGLFGKLLHYLDLARPYGFRFQFVLHEDYTKPIYFDGYALETYAMPWYRGADLSKLPACRRRFIRDRRLIDDISLKYTDPDVIACQDMYTREIVGLLKGNPMLFGYELENEMVGCPPSWVSHQIKLIHAVDPSVPICVSHGGGGLFTADPVWWRARTAVDYYTPHLYPDPPSTSPSVDYGLAVDVLMRYCRLAGPAFLGESSGDQFTQHPSRDTRRWTMRDIIWFSLTNGAPGCFFWNARKSEVAEYRLAHDIAARIDWRSFRRRPAPVVCLVPHPLKDDQWFNTSSGRAAYDAMAKYAELALDCGADLDFALATPPRRQTVDGRKFNPATPLHSAFAVSTGFQLKPLVSLDGATALLYVRNVSGVERWDSTGDPRTTQYLRTRSIAPLSLTVNLPGRFIAEIWDLDSHDRATQTIVSGRPFALGATDHDFALLLRRQ
jgi:hypothetical protein